MANLTLELNIYSAKDLENVNLITKMDVYAVAWITGDDSQKIHKEKTVVDRTGGSELTWNHAVKFSVNQRLAREGRLTLVVKLVCDRIFGGKDLGEVQVPVLELLNSSPSFNGDGSVNGQGMRFVTYQVRTPCGKGQGSLTFSYRFDTPSFKPDLPASPVHPNPIDAFPDFPSTQSGAGFYPPPPSIGYPPSSQPEGYSAPPYPSPYPHQYDSPYPEQPVTTYPPSSSGSNLYPPPHHPNLYPPQHTNVYPPQHPNVYPPQHPNVYPPQDTNEYPPQHPNVYPPPSGHSYHQSQPSQSLHGYAAPSPQYQHGYGFPPLPPGHGYGSPHSQQPPKKNKPGLGLGMGAGLLGGALGGLLLGDMVSDIGFDF